MKKRSILELAYLLSKAGRGDELWNLIKGIRPFLKLISDEKGSCLVRALVDLFLDMDAGTGMEEDLCTECIEWAKQENRTFLRQSLQARLISLYYETHKYADALQLGSSLLKELEEIGDKELLIEVQLLGSKVYHALSNLPKARACLTSARTTANAIYCPPKLQSALTFQSGILLTTDKSGFKAAFNFFYQAFEFYDSIESPKAVVALKYMLLSKIMLNLFDEVHSLIMRQFVLKYAGPEIDAMKAIAEASEKRSMADFQAALTKYPKQLCDDVIIKAHLNTLYDAILEQNLCRITEPCSRVQITVEEENSASTENLKINSNSCHAIFWDYENVSISKNQSIYDTVQRVRNFFLTQSLEVAFIACFDVRKIPKKVTDQLELAQVDIHHVSSCAKNAADERLKLKMLEFSQIYETKSLSLILISGDINFSPVMWFLKNAKNVNIILLHPNNVNKSLLDSATEHYEFSSIAVLAAESVAKATESGSQPSSLLISNLPTRKKITTIKNRLSQLINNCGGKIKQIKNGQAIIFYPTKEDAQRSLNKLKNERLFMKKIQVVLLEREAATTASERVNNLESDVESDVNSSEELYSSEVSLLEEINISSLDDSASTIVLPSKRKIESSSSEENQKKLKTNDKVSKLTAPMPPHETTVSPQPEVECTKSDWEEEEKDEELEEEKRAAEDYAAENQSTESQDDLKDFI